MWNTILQSPAAIGLEITNQVLKEAEVSLKAGKPRLKDLFTTPLQSDDVKRLYNNPAILVTALDAGDVLVRPFFIPLTKEKDIAASLPFQAEPLLPYPADQALLAKQTISQNEEGTHLTLLSTHKELLKNHLAFWQNYTIEPEKIASVQTALCQFGKIYINSENPYAIFHLNDHWMTCVLLKEGKLLASYTHHEGLNLLDQASESDFSRIDYSSLQPESPLANAVKKLQQGISKIYFALNKDCKEMKIEGVLLTGDAVKLKHFEHLLFEKIPLPLMECSSTIDSEYSIPQKLQFAVPIGLAYGSFQDAIDFRQGELVYPNPWKRLKMPIAAYFILMLILSISFYLFGSVYLSDKEDQIKKDYVNLLNSMSKTHEQFENQYYAKHLQGKGTAEVIPIINLNKNQLLQRLEYLYKDLQATPDSFPLFANVPNVSDVLAWLSHHPYIKFKKEDGSVENRLQLENFTYSMVKRPMQGKKQDKYQVKIDLEFSSATPKWAREFHDALIAPNDFVDPKAEVKWTSNRGHYRTSFFLKDKTIYHSQ